MAEEKMKNESLDDMLDDSVKEQVESAEKSEISSASDEAESDESSIITMEDFLNLNMGEAFDVDELYAFTAKRDVNFVVVAGPFESGKTTLEAIMYYLFRFGCNQKLSFVSSYTIKGFLKRSKDMMLSSGGKESTIDRTRRADKDNYLHLELCDNQSGRKENFIFTDIAGEVYTEIEKLRDYSEYLKNSDTAIVLIDGDRLSRGETRLDAYTTAVTIIRNLLNVNIINKKTNLLIVCTKKDKMDSAEQTNGAFDYWEKRKDKLQEKFRNNVNSITFFCLSALEFKEEKNSTEIEKLLIHCFSEKEPEERRWKESEEVVAWDELREMERYGMRG